VLTAKLKGGLGNQLFQYAFIKALSYQRKHPDEFRLDLSVYRLKNNRGFELDAFNLPPHVTDQGDLPFRFARFFRFKTLPYKLFSVLDILLFRTTYFQRGMVSPAFDQLDAYDYFDGYWQSESYFSAIRDELLEDLSLRDEKLLDFNPPKDAVALGFRRGDYVDDPKNKAKYDLYSETYYRSAIRHFTQTMDHPVFYVFTDDHAWIQKNFDFQGASVVFVNEDKRLSPAHELIMMSRCFHAIIPNSTFSWWGAWLIENPDKTVICPKGWYADDMPNDIIPDTWIQMDQNGETS
jgi:hypothetical protein